VVVVAAVVVIVVRGIMVWFRFAVLAIRAGGLCVVVVEGRYDWESLWVWAVRRPALSSHPVPFVVAHDRNVSRPAMQGEFCPVGRVASEIKVRPVVWYWIFREGELEW